MLNSMVVNPVVAAVFHSGAIFHAGARHQLIIKHRVSNFTRDHTFLTDWLTNIVSSIEQQWHGLPSQQSFSLCSPASIQMCNPYLTFIFGSPQFSRHRSQQAVFPHLKYQTFPFPEQTNHTAFISSCSYPDLSSICLSAFFLQSPFRPPLLSSLVTHMLQLQRCPDASNLQHWSPPAKGWPTWDPPH